MKKLLFILLLAIACIGCKRPTPTDNNAESAIYGWNYLSGTKEYGSIGFIRYRTIIINNHEYLMFTNKDGYSGGICVIHSESCPCKQKRK